MMSAAAAYQRRDWAEVERLCRSILRITSNHFDALNFLGAVLAQTGRPAEAIILFRRASRLKPQDATIHNNIGNVLKQLGQQEAALESYEEALRLRPDYVDALGNKGRLLFALARFDAALGCYDKLLAITPDHIEAMIGRGNALIELCRYDAAISAFDRVLQINPDHAGALNNRGNALRLSQQFDAALICHDRAIILKPDQAEFHNNRGNTLRDLKRFSEALQAFDRALVLAPHYANAYSNRGNVLKDLGQSEAAIESYRQALKEKPDHFNACYNMASALQEAKRYPEALQAYDLASTLDPGDSDLYGQRWHVQSHLCDWRHFNERGTDLCAAIAEGKNASPPFPFLTAVDNPALQRRCVETWLKKVAPVEAAYPAAVTRRAGEKIRIGYYSADFYDHPTAYLAIGMFEHHDRSDFEYHAFSFGRSDGKMHRRLAAAFDTFHEVKTLTDADIVDRSRRCGIDIAIDLKGFTQEQRIGIFSRRAAPVQINFLGYPGTMGAPYIDYMIADRVIIPDIARPYYAEKIIYMPHSYQPNDRARTVEDKIYSRPELGLPEQSMVFCCFNSLYKVTPDLFDIWMRILAKVPDSVLWLLDDNIWAPDNLRREAARRDIAPDRLIFAERAPQAVHLARQKAADLFLDTFPCNAHTTASDALWAGLPVLTCPGQSFVSRVAASLLTAVDLPELIATDPVSYEQIALSLAHDRSRLQSLKTTLLQNQLTKPLYDTQAYTRALESAYRQIHRRSLAGLPPVDLEIGG